MRTLRLALAGMIAVTLLGGLAGAVVAQDESESTTPAVVAGTESCVTRDTGTQAYAADGLVTWRDFLSDCVDTTSDPRVNGTFRNTFNQDCHALPDGSGDSACVLWGTHVLEGDDGGWDCSWAGIDDLWGPNDGQVFVVCPGTGEYTGLTYVFQHVFGGAQDFGDGTDIRGVIYEGPPPALLDVPAE